MTYKKLMLTGTALILSLGLSACGAGGGGDGLGGDAPSTPTMVPVEGMSFDSAQRVEIQHDETKSFDFTNDSNQSDRGSGGNITFTAGRETTQGDADTNTAVNIKFNSLANSGGEINRREAYLTGRDETLTRENQIDVEDVGGQDVIYARKVDLNTDGSFSNNNSFIYIPSAGNTNTYVGMAGIVGDDTDANFVGLFGRRTTSAEVSRQRGQATYSGITQGVARNVGTQTTPANGEYRGTTTATVDFDAATSPTFATNGTMTHERDGIETVTYAFNGALNSDGSLTTTGATLQGQATSNHTVSGGLFGPNGESLGYVYSATGAPQNDHTNNMTLSGGAILNKN